MSSSANLPVQMNLGYGPDGKLWIAVAMSVGLLSTQFVVPVASAKKFVEEFSLNMLDMVEQAEAMPQTAKEARNAARWAPGGGGKLELPDMDNPNLRDAVLRASQVKD